MRRVQVQILTWGLFGENMHHFLVHAWDISGYRVFIFLPQVKKMHVRLIGDSNLPSGGSVCVCTQLFCLCWFCHRLTCPECSMRLFSCWLLGCAPVSIWTLKRIKRVQKIWTGTSENSVQKIKPTLKYCKLCKKCSSKMPWIYLGYSNVAETLSIVHS